MENLDTKNKVRVNSGIYINPFNMTKNEISILDIAHSLSQKPRFNGNLNFYYSVADHSVWIANKLEEKVPYNPKLCLRGLLHDASEAYLWDIPTPLKEYPQMEQLSKAVQDLQRLIDSKYLTESWTEEHNNAIKKLDRKALEIEWNCMMISYSGRDRNWRHSKIMFLRKFLQYVKDCGDTGVTDQAREEMNEVYNSKPYKIDPILYKPMRGFYVFGNILEQVTSYE